MIQSLQKRFIRTAMVAVTVLMLLMLGVINVSNILMVDRQVEKTLLMIAENEGMMPAVPTMPPQEIGRGPKNEYDTFLASNFFVVRFGDNGEITLTDISRVASLTEEEAQEMARQAYSLSHRQGRMGRFRYVLRESRLMPGRVAVFLDASGERHSYGRVLLLSLGVGVVCWLGMLLLVMLLSKQAIRPIAENMHRQQQFITNAGHELKTPLAIIQANAEAMELYTGENKWSRNIRAQISRLTGLTNNLLAMARMEEEKQSAFTPVELSHIVQESAASFAPSLQLREITLQLDAAPDVTVLGNREQLGQLVSVLLDNAAKYTNTGGFVRVQLHRAEQYVQLSVANSVETLPDVPAEKLFDRFYRADGARTQKTGGCGIGLSVARRVAQIHGGTLDAAYEGSKGVCFSANFPLQP